MILQQPKHKNLYIFISATVLALLAFLIAFSYVNRTVREAQKKADDKEEFLAIIEKDSDADTLKKRGYELVKVELKSTPNLYKVKRTKVSTTDALLEGLIVKKEMENKKLDLLGLKNFQLLQDNKPPPSNSPPLRPPTGNPVNDAYYSKQWNLPKTETDRAWSLGANGKPTITVAVIDGGINMGMNPKNPIHEDLDGKFWTNADEIPGNGIDDDHNGKIDDVHGWDFYHQNFANGSEDNDPSPEASAYANPICATHATHVAGIISASTNNKVGVAGIARDIKIMPLKVFTSDCYSDTTIAAKALEYAADNGANIVNMSWGGYDDSPPILENAIKYAHSKGVILVAAAGNGDAKGNPYARLPYPANYPNVISVGATDSNDQRASFSEYGKDLDIMAPGVDIASSITTQNINSGGYGDDYTNNQYGYLSGTSMAAPHVVAAAALMLSQNPKLTPDQAENRLLLNTDKLPDMNGQDRTDDYGYGRLNVRKAVFNMPFTLVKSPDKGDIYLIEDNNTKRLISNMDTFNNWGFNNADIQTVSSSELDKYKTAEFPLTRLVTSGDNIFFVENGKKRNTTKETIGFYGYLWQVTQNVPGKTLGYLVDGPKLSMPSLVTDGTKKIYFLENGKKRFIIDSDTFTNWGFKKEDIVTPASFSGINAMPAGDPLTRLIHDPTEGKIYHVENGSKRYIWNMAFNLNNFNWYDVHNVSKSLLDTLPTGSDLSIPKVVLHSYGGAAFVIENEKKRWIVNPDTFDNWGFKDSDRFYAKNDAYLDSIATGEPLTRIILDPTTKKVYYADSGQKRWIYPVAWEAHHFSMYDMHSASKQLLDSLPTGPDLTQ